MHMNMMYIIIYTYHYIIWIPVACATTVMFEAGRYRIWLVIFVRNLFSRFSRVKSHIRKN